MSQTKRWICFWPLTSTAWTVWSRFAKKKLLLIATTSSTRYLWPTASKTRRLCRARKPFFDRTSTNWWHPLTRRIGCPEPCSFNWFRITLNSNWRRHVKSVKSVMREILVDCRLSCQLFSNLSDDLHPWNCPSDSIKIWIISPALLRMVF